MKQNKEKQLTRTYYYISPSRISLELEKDTELMQVFSKEGIKTLTHTILNSVPTSELKIWEYEISQVSTFITNAIIKELNHVSYLWADKCYKKIQLIIKEQSEIKKEVA